MKVIRFEYKELETEASFTLLGKSFGGTQHSNTLQFDNNIVKGELIKVVPENGLWIRKWKLVVFQKIMLQRLAAQEHQEKKYNLIYFLNGCLFDLKHRHKKISLNNHCNTLFVSDRVMMDFSVVPRQPFYVVDITFTEEWLQAQFADASDDFKLFLQHFLSSDAKAIFQQPCHPVAYRVLQELDEADDSAWAAQLLIRSRVYQLVRNFFFNAFNSKGATPKNQALYYDQLVQAEKMVSADLKRPPTTEAIARHVNMSTSVLLRQFKLMYGKSINEYHVEKKMELAKKMIVQKGVPVNKVAESLGYKKASPFIESFTRQYGYSPGSLKLS